MSDYVCEGSLIYLTDAENLDRAVVQAREAISELQDITVPAQPLDCTWQQDTGNGLTQYGLTVRFSVAVSYDDARDNVHEQLPNEDAETEIRRSAERIACHRAQRAVETARGDFQIEDPPELAR